MAEFDQPKSKPAAKPRKPAVPKPGIGTPVLNQMPAAVEAVAEQFVPSPAQSAETIEAVTSPAVHSDAIEARAVDPVEPAPTHEEVVDMATVASPTEATDTAQAAFTDYSSRFKSAFERSSKLSEELVDLAKGNVEALIASARVAAKASEQLGQEAAEYGKRHFDSATSVFKSFASVKSPTELFQLQSEFAKSSFDSAVAEASRVSESLMKVAGDIAQPLSNRYSLAAEKIKSATL